MCRFCIFVCVCVFVCVIWWVADFFFSKFDVKLCIRSILYNVSSESYTGLWLNEWCHIWFYICICQCCVSPCMLIFLALDGFPLRTGVVGSFLVLLFLVLRFSYTNLVVPAREGCATFNVVYVLYLLFVIVTNLSKFCRFVFCLLDIQFVDDQYFDETYTCCHYTTLNYVFYN